MNFNADITVAQNISEVFSTDLSASLSLNAILEFYEGQLVWTTSNVTYWNEQNALGNAGTESSNPSAATQPLADAEDYSVGYAMRCSDGSLPLTYYYYKVINTRR